MSKPVLTLVMPYYEDADMLGIQYAEWASWADEVKDRVEVALVDDGSPSRPATSVERPDGLPTLRIYRIGIDRAWNQHGARNLGAEMARAPWLLLTDCDHVISGSHAAELVRRIEAGALAADAAYTLARVEADTGEPTKGRTGEPKPHPNSFVMTRRLYNEIGGYDEDYCGVYGTDRLFRRRLEKKASVGHLADIVLRRYSEDMFGLARHTLPRKEGRKPRAKEMVAEQKRRRGELGVIKRLQFPWARVL